MIAPELLEQYGAKVVEYKKGNYIFEEGAMPRYYFQVIEGKVKVSYCIDKGNEFIQGIFGSHQSFGDPPLLTDYDYQMDAIAMSSVKVWRLSKTTFKELLHEHPDVHFSFTKTLAKRLSYKAEMIKAVTTNSAEEAILLLLDFLKDKVYHQSEPFSCHINLTRKTIAALTGLSTETAIRKIKELEAKHQLKIIDSQVYY